MANSSNNNFDPYKFFPRGTKNEALTEEQLNTLNFLRSKMIVYEDRDKWQSAYNFMQFVNPYNLIEGTREYIFFTKPNLNIINIVEGSQTVGQLNPAIANNSFWVEMYHNYRDDIACLQKHDGAKRAGNPIDQHPFIPLLSNSVASTLSLPSIDADTSETAASMYGTTLQYRGDSLKSDEGYDFNLEFKDNKSLEVYYFFKMWDEYSKLKKQGIVSPPNLNEGVTTGEYRTLRILHDQIAIYRFLVDENDMSSIIHYAKFIGCFPKSVPRDSFDSLEGEIKYSISWHAQWVYDSDPIILYEFNQVCNKYFGASGPDSTKRIQLYNKDIDAVDGNWRPHPYIVQTNTSRRAGAQYQLVWFSK